MDSDEKAIKDLEAETIYTMQIQVKCRFAAHCFLQGILIRRGSSVRLRPEPPTVTSRSDPSAKSVVVGGGGGRVYVA
jgi:hypothetical protein